MNKLIKEALKDIARVDKELPVYKEHAIKYWLGHLYRQGYMAGLVWTIENRKQHDKDK